MSGMCARKHLKIALNNISA